MKIYPLIMKQLISKFEEIKTAMLKAVNQLNDDQVNWRPNKQSNSVSNLVVHIEGNIKQRIAFED